MRTRVVVSAIIEKGDSALLGKKEPGRGPYAGCWLLVGGGVREDESLIDAIRREVKEETDLDISQFVAIGFDEDFTKDSEERDTHFIFINFKARWTIGEPHPLDDLKELRWIKKSELPKLDLPPPSLRLLKSIGLI